MVLYIASHKRRNEATRTQTKGAQAMRIKGMTVLTIDGRNSTALCTAQGASAIMVESMRLTAELAMQHGCTVRYYSTRNISAK